MRKAHVCLLLAVCCLLCTTIQAAGTTSSLKPAPRAATSSSKPSSTGKLTGPVDKNQPVRGFMVSPPNTYMKPPFFPVGAVVNLTWKYDKPFVKGPNNLTIHISHPKLKIEYDVVTGLSGSSKSYMWDTNQYKQEAGVPFPAEDGYTMYIYDERGKDAMPVAGSLVRISFMFTLYSSTYDSANPKLLCPSCAAKVAEQQSSGPPPATLGSLIFATILFLWML